MCGAWLALALFAAMPRIAHAALHRARIAIVFAEGFDDRQGVVHDLASEFLAEGFDVRLIGKEVDDAPLDDWAKRARDDGARALIHVVPGGAGDAVIEVLLVRPDNLVFKDTIRCQASDGSDIASVRAVEVTRAALIEVREPPPVPSSDWDIVRDDPYASRVPARSPFIAASVSPVLTMTGSSLDLLDVGVNLSWLPADYVGFEIQGAIPLGRGSENAAGGTLYVETTFVDIGASLSFTRRDASFRPYFAVRGGAMAFSLSSDATRTAQTSVSYFSVAALGASVEVHGFLRLRAEGCIGASTSSPTLGTDPLGIDNIGIPIALLGVGPEFTW
jgi:hypothetical protein